MEKLTKKTTILFPPDLYDQLVRLADQQGVSMADLVRTACKERYGLVPEQDRLKAVDTLAELNLPVDTPQEMERQSMPDADGLLP